VVSFIGGGNPDYPEKSADLLQVTDKLSHDVVLSTPHLGFDLTMLMVLCTDCIGSSKSNYHTITTMTAPIFSMIFISRQFTLQTVDLIHYNLVLSLFTDEEPESPRSVDKSEESVDPSDVSVTEKTETEEGKTEEVKERGGAEGGQSEEEQNDEKENGMRLKYIFIYMYNQTHFMV